MTNTKMTKATALETIMAYAGEVDTEVRAKGEKMLADLRKPRPKKDSEAKRFNEDAARWISENVPAGTEIDTKWIAEHVKHVNHTQKATYIIRAGVELGLFEKVPPATKSAKPTYVVLQKILN